VSAAGPVSDNEASFTLDAGVFGIVGRNGMGKTTLCNAITGLVKATGRVVLAGEQILGLGPLAEVLSPPELRERLARVDEGGAERVVLDLSEVTLVDSMALGVLLGAKKRLATHAGAIDLVVSKSDIRRIFEITMLDRIFTLYASREEALQVDGAASADSVE